MIRNVVAFCKIKLDWNKMLLILIVEATWHPISNQHIKYQLSIINDKWKVLKIAIRLICDCAIKYQILKKHLFEGWTKNSWNTKMFNLVAFEED